MAIIIALVEMLWCGEVELTAELDDGDVVLVDRWYTDERHGHVQPHEFPALVGTGIQTLQDRVHR